MIRGSWQTALFCHDLQPIPESEFVGPIIRTIQQFKADFLSGEVSQINADVAPDDFSGIVANVGLMSSLPIDNNGQLPVTLSVRGN